MAIVTNEKSVIERLTPFNDRIIKINVHYENSEWNKWAATAIPMARTMQAKLMANVDYAGMIKAQEISGAESIIGDKMPMLWPLDEASFEYANHKAAKNSTKPGDVLACPVFSVSSVIVKVVSRNGKKQALEVLKGPEMGPFYWHADYNNLFFRVLGKKDIKRLGLQRLF